MSATSPTPSEHHLGDRLAALVDGELGHDERERVLAHLATCARCKSEADCQRRLKTFFAEVAPPPPSEGFLARLQSLPAGGSKPPGDDEGQGPFGRRGLGHEPFGHGVFDASDDMGTLMDSFGYAGAHGASVFPVHRAGRPEAERTSPWRGKRFAFAAASAVSLAAMALGGALPLGASQDSPRGNVIPLRAAGQSTTAEAGRRNSGFGGGGGLLPRSGSSARVVAAPGTLQARNLPALSALSAPAGASVLSARAFAAPSFATPSLQATPFPASAFPTSAFPADMVNSAPPSPLASATGSAQAMGADPGAASATAAPTPGQSSGAAASGAHAGTPRPELLAGPSPLSGSR
ncbi:anti-sigma factor family protein [Streptomyces sp. 8L]|uniref:anti-sigma factor family protein n=1 Tax=Streptomyces sp. 8L TaxID=2877242 RepID=UPI001CD6AC3A|nr:anti-sigma factor [Streptomyces sp. 8L]MCA1217715.1 zf-HC2 domain-containing protein [Streptomyces sp. 8L]